jgi:hypothetical protein
MAKESVSGKSGCKSPSHGRHLCYIVSQGFHLSDPQEYQSLVKEPEFKCRHCGRVAKSENNLCKPTEL